jgi:chorismate synthase
MLRFLTAGESHGKGLVVILEGMPAGVRIDFDAVNEQLKRRQGGYGRGRRMAIESDRTEVLSGVRAGETLGSPVSLLIRNKDWENWQQTMHAEAEAPEGATGALRPVVTRPRPGHADLAGAIKYDRTDIRDVLERASARETAARVAAGAVARQLLSAFDVEIVSHVYRVNGIGLDSPLHVTFEAARDIGSDSALRCADPDAEVNMIAEIDRCREAGDTAGGAFEVIARGLPVGLGSYVHWDRKLDGRLAHAMMSIPAIKGVGIGIGPKAASVPGSQMHDEIVPAPGRLKPPIGVSRPTNNAGGLEGGVTNGEDLRVSGFMKPIATLMKPLRSVDLAGMTAAPAVIERSDVCAISAAAVVGEAVVSLVLADAFLEKFSGDSLKEIQRNYANATERLQARFTSQRPARPKRAEREGGPAAPKRERNGEREGGPAAPKRERNGEREGG